MNGAFNHVPPMQRPHFVLVPQMAQGHTIPMIDMAYILAGHGAVVTFVTTPRNAARIESIIQHIRNSQLPIQFVPLPFKGTEVGLPEGCESVDSLPLGLKQLSTFVEASLQLQDPLISYLRENDPPPSCIISDMTHPWTGAIAREFGVPRLSFIGFSAFSSLVRYLINIHKVYDNVVDDFVSVPIPGFPHPLELPKTRSTLSFYASGERIFNMVKEEESKNIGVIVNTFQDLEPLYIKSYDNTIAKKVWSIGPMCLFNKDMTTVASRGEKASIDVDRCLQWLDSMQNRSVIYVSFGSLVRSMPLQLIEIGLGLEASKKPFIWVIKAGEKMSEIEQWLIEENFEERVKDRGLIIRGWAPQVMILSHNAIGGFMTHCGWNSTIEGICAGVPMLTWPHFAEQFLNEVLVVDILKIGIRIGVMSSVTWGSEKTDEVKIKRNEVEKKVLELLTEGGGGLERRLKASELGKMAKMAMEEGGSSYNNIELLIHEIKERMHRNKDKAQT
ncbi:Glycosyltransferase [Rhynchospora pubera]|uniref:Glycosyltransferase n=1 Tax=Rhynchospora pubera TaxID=906938 RepID=A0AAV8DXQ4_9POAL|nr:Glycosyltransferase [Rhynchospora pubera]